MLETWNSIAEKRSKNRRFRKNLHFALLAQRSIESDVKTRIVVSLLFDILTFQNKKVDLKWKTG
jgi:hypothetical protein